MPDENGTEATQDAQNAYESLFGDETPKPAAVVVEEEGTTDSTGQEAQGSDAAEKQDSGDESGPADDQAAEDGSRSVENEAGGDESGPPEDTTSEGKGLPADSPTSEGEGSPAEDLKVVVSIRGGSATIGVQRPSADPHIELVDDPDLSGLVREVPAVVERARAKWDDEPKYPAHTRPAASTGRRGRRGQGTAQAATTEGGADQQQPEALRLF